MKQVIWKYPLQILDTQTIRVPLGAKPLSVGLQGDSPCIWFQVDSEQENLSTWLIRFAGTGHPLAVDKYSWSPDEFVGTVEFTCRGFLGDNKLYFHIYAKLV